MKRITIVILMLLLVFPARSEEVSKEKALKVAENFLTPATRGTSEPLELVWDGEDSQTKGTCAPAFYVFSRKSGGFVVVSGESALSPIVAYSYDSPFKAEGMPENLEAWFSELRDNINSWRGSAATPKVVMEWEKYSSQTKAAAEIPPVLVYKTAKWGQDYPFNLLCPVDHMYERISKVGCTAVSFATLLHYWKWPDAGVGRFPSYWASDKHYVAPEIILGHEYQWDLMLDDYYAEGVTPTEEQNNAVAVLCRDVAQGGKSIFGANGASGDQTRTIQNLTEPFKLTRKVRKLFRMHFTPEDWVRTMVEGLQFGPIYYGVRHNDGGHAIVADGYDSNGFIHFNWGFYGMNDGFYDTSIENLNGAMFYPNSHSAIIGVGPRTDDEVQEGTLYYGNGVKCGVSITSGTPVQGSSFTVSLTSVYSGCPFDFQPEFAVAHIDKDFKVKSLVSEIDKTPLMAAGSYVSLTGISCRITEPVEFGDAIAMVYHTSEIATEWSLTRYSVQSDAKIVNGVYPLTEAKSVAQSAVLSYNPSSNRYSISCTQRSDCTLLKPDGTPAGGLSGSNGKFEINAGSLSAGTYKVVLSHKDYKDVKEFSIVIR